MSLRLPIRLLLCVLALFADFRGVVVSAADHGDVPFLREIGRSDAQLAGLFAFSRDDKLVIILTSDPAIPSEVTEYIFPTDVKFRICIDNDSEVVFDDPFDLEKFGGTVVQPKKINPDIVFKISFKDDNRPRLKSNRRKFLEHAKLFTGLRDDPFIRKPREGRNIAAMVLEIPLEDVLAKQSTLLVWAEAKLKGIKGKMQDLAGQALRSQLPENALMNELRPKKHSKKLGLAPDVVIYDTSIEAAFPNGRELTDDVVDLVGVMLPGEDPSPTTNDVPFLEEFPYLAPPHQPQESDSLL